MSPPILTHLTPHSHTPPQQSPSAPRYFSQLISQTHQATSSHLPSFSLTSLSLNQTSISPSRTMHHAPSIHPAPRTIHHPSSIPLPPSSPSKEKREEEEEEKTKPRRRQRHGAFSTQTTEKTARMGVDQGERKAYRNRSVRSGWSPGWGKSQGNAASSRPFDG